MGGSGYLIFGVAILASEVLLGRWTAARLRERGESPAVAWRARAVSPLTWLGMILIVGVVSPLAAGLLLVGGGLLAVSFCVVLFVRGVRGISEFVRELRRIGDPEAWRGQAAE